ncbi:hypothetical protein Aperf_G00000004682 [Anoplocephala perfoliata]
MSKSPEAHRGKKKATKLVIVVVIVFAACWLPIQVVFMIQNFYSDTSTMAFRLFHIMGNILSYGNSCVNPILYAFFSNAFRAGFASLICLDKSKMRNVPYESKVDQTEMLHAENTRRTTVISVHEEPPRGDNVNVRHMKKGNQKEVSFVESVCVHPLTQYPPEGTENLSD